MNPEYGNFDGTPMDKELPWGGKHDKFFSDAYRTAANIGLDYIWFGKDEGHYAAPLRLMRYLKTDLEAARCVFEVDGTVTEEQVLHPLGLLATTAQGALSVPAEDEEGYAVAKRWVEWFWNQPLREGDRRYYDNCLYLFAILALSGNYRIY
jgi:oligosaccharide reducing-end xylanase